MSSTQLTAEEDADLKRVVKAYESAESTHRSFRTRAEHFYRLYRGHQKFNEQFRGAGEDERRQEAKRQWGAELFIPYCFSTIETIVPRAVSQRPRMLVLPRNQDSERNVEPMKLTIDAQQEQIDYDLTLQDVLRTGLIYGIGFQKEYWDVDWVQRRVAKRRVLPKVMTGRKAYVVGRPTWEKTFDDPMAEWVDPFDLIWDPYGDSLAKGPGLRMCQWVIHRIWMSTEEVMKRLEPRGDRPALWSTDAAKKLNRKDVEGMGGGDQSYSSIWTERMAAAGHTNINRRGENLHEVWEFHTTDKIITILDRKIPVLSGESPTLGMLPFQAYRPTRVAGEMIGIGEIEPIEHLQLELNTLRSQRRDNATLKLMQTYAYNDAVIDADDIVWGPGVAIPVNGDPGNAIKRLDVGDIPNSSYQEEAAVVNDIHRTSGIDDTVSGADGSSGGASSTATGVQLVQAAANARIELKARRLEVEVIRGAARVWGRLNQRMILEERERRVSQEADPAEPDTKRYTWFRVGPDQLRGEFDYVPDGGSTQPENVPQLRQDAQTLWQTFHGDPNVDQQWLVRTVLEKLGFKHPEVALANSDKAIPKGVLDRLEAAGVPKQLLETAVAMEMRIDPTGGQTPAEPEMPVAA